MTEQKLPPLDRLLSTARRGPWQVPLVLVAAAALPARRHDVASQAPQLQEANQFRARLQAIGSETARLADGGDATAKKTMK